MDSEIFFFTLAFCLVVLVVLGVPFLFAAYVRRLKHKETMAMVEKGLLKPSNLEGNGKATLRWGIVVTALGLALCLGLYPLGFWFGGNFPLNFGPWMLMGLLPLFFGLALIVIYLVTLDKENGKKDSDQAFLNPVSESDEKKIEKEELKF
jgi:uncharacterized membrane protein